MEGWRKGSEGITGRFPTSLQAEGREGGVECITPTHIWTDILWRALSYSARKNSRARETERKTERAQDKGMERER